MKAIDKFRIEMERLEILHLGTLYAYDEVIQRHEQRISDGYINEDDLVKVTLSPSYKYDTVACDKSDLKRKYKRQFREHLRETLFVRLISTLEVYLIDSIKELFMKRRDLFHKDEKITLSHRQILSVKSVSEIYSKLINKECRALQNSGFDKIVAYYKNQLGIELKKFQYISRLPEYHERRHLLVHRLGKTDEKYRHRYGCKASQIGVGKNYLLESFDTINSLAEFISVRINDVMEQKNISNLYELTAKVQLKIRTLTDYGTESLESQYIFEREDDLIAIKDILVSRISIEKNVDILDLEGRVEDIEAYLEHLSGLAITSELEVIQQDKIRWIDKRLRKLPKGMLFKIESSLGKQPWDVGVHREIADKLGLSKSLVYDAIEYIKSKPNENSNS